MTALVGSYANDFGSTWTVEARKNAVWLTVKKKRMLLTRDEALHLADKLREAEAEAGADRWPS